MTSKPKKVIDPSLMSEERVRGSVFDRLGAKQTMSPQHHPQSYHQIRSNSNKLQSSKYENHHSLDARRKLDSSMHSSHQRHFNTMNQYGQQSEPDHPNQYHHSQHRTMQDAYYNKSTRTSNIPGHKQMLKSKINKPDDYNHHDQYKKHYNEQGAEVLEKKRVEITRELQKIDQRDQQQSSSNIKHHSSRICKSPCSSNSVCSSSGSESGSESYSGSSSGSCSSSSCSSSSSSFSENEERTTSHKNYKKNVSTISMQPSNQRQSYVAVDRTRNVHPHSPLPSHQQETKASKRYIDQMHASSSVKRLRSRSPQSTTSSYYSRKSRAGPLTPPLPSSHSLSNLSTNTPNSSTNNKTHSGSESYKLDRHGNIRVSLKDKERHRKVNYNQSDDKLNSSPSFSSPQNLSINNYSKSSRSPLDRSREDLYSSFGSVDERKKFTPSPVNYHPLPLQRKPNYPTYDDNRSPSSFYYGNSNKRTGSTSSLRQNLNTSNPQFHRSPSYLSPSVDHGHMLSPRTPLPSHVMNKPKMYNYQHNNNNNNSFEDQSTPHPLDPLVINRSHQQQQQQSQIKRHYNKLYNNSTFVPQPHQQQPQPMTDHYSPIRAKGPLSNTHHSHPYPNHDHKKPSFVNFNQNKNLPIKNINIKQTNQPPFNPQLQHQSQNIVKQPIIKSPQQPKSQFTPTASVTKIADQLASDEMSSISNNSLDDIDETKEQIVKNDEKKLIESNADKQNDCKDEMKNELNANESNKNEEAFSDENFSEWSDVEDYGNVTSKQEETNKTQQTQDNYDDLKFKIEEELEAISDEEFDAIIDKQDNEKNGMLSCKQVLDQLDINWASLIRDKESNEEDRKQSITSSAKSRFKSARLLSQIGISFNYSGNELKNLIRNYCSLQSKDENFNFESPLAVLHSLKLRKKKLNCKKDENSTNHLESTQDNVEFLSNGNLCSNKLLSFNHLVVSLSKCTSDEKTKSSATISEDKIEMRQDVAIRNEADESRIVVDAVSVP